jgi:hypothetical protein
LHGRRDHILEEMLHNIINHYVEVIQDMKKGNAAFYSIAKSEWKKIKEFCCQNIERNPKGIKDKEVLEFYKEDLWHDLDWQYVDFGKGYINNYKKILKDY